MPTMVYVSTVASFPGSLLKKTWEGESLVTFVRKAVDCFIIRVISKRHALQ